MNTKKWVGHADKINKLKGYKLKDLETKILVDVSAIESTKQNLVNDKSFEVRLREIEREQVDILNDIVEKDKKIADLTANALDKWANSTTGFKVVENYQGKMEAWLTASDDEKYSNRYEVNFKGNVFFATTDEVKRMISLVAKKMEDIDDADFVAKLSSSFITSTTDRTNAATWLTNVKNWTKKAHPLKSKDGKSWTGERELWSMKPDAITNITPKFPFKDFFQLILLIAPKHDYSLIRNLSDTNITKEQEWFIIPAKGEYSKKEKEYFVTTGQAAEKGKIYKSGNRADGKKFKVEKGLEDWIELFYSVFLEKNNRVKYIWNLEGDGGSLPPNPLEDLLNRLETPAFKSSYVYSYTDREGLTEQVYCITDVNEIINTEKVRKQELESGKVIKEKEIADQAILLNNHKKLIYDEEKKLVDEDNKIQTLVLAEIVAKQKKVDDMGLNDSNFKYDEAKNILKACAAKQLLLDIKWLENEGDDNKPFKNSTNKTLLDIINANQNSVASWNSVVKSEFENKGSTLAERIAKVKSEVSSGGIGLEIYRDAFLQLGDQTVVDAINTELAKDKIPPQTTLTPADLNEKLGLTDADQALVDKWKTVDGVSFDKAKIGTVVDAHLTDATKKGKLIEHIKKLPSSEGIDKTSDATVLTSFFKKEPSKVIKTIIAHEIDDGVINKATIIKEMKEYKSTDGKNVLNLSNYGGDEPNDEGVIQYLYEKKIGKPFQTKAVPGAPENPNPSPSTEPKPWYARFYYASIWGTAILILGGVAVWYFWDKIWGGEVRGEGEKEDNEE